MSKAVVAFVVGFAVGGVIFFFVGSGGGRADRPTPAPTPRGETPAGGSGRTVRIAFSSPGADHGWLAAIQQNARTAAHDLGDVELLLTDGLNNSAKQMADVEDLLQKDIDAMVMLPHEGDALVPAAEKVRTAGVPLINLDRKIPSDDWFCYLGGDNHGIGVAAARYIGRTLKGTGRVLEIQGLAGISVTEDRSRGFEETLRKEFPGIEIVAKQPADFKAETALRVTQNLLQAHSDVDAIYSHDDDQNEGVLKAVLEARRGGELFITGCGGSRWAFDHIKADNTPVKASFFYNPSMAGSAVHLARLIALKRGMGDLWEREVPHEIVLQATTVTKENVDQFMHLGY